MASCEANLNFGLVETKRIYCKSLALKKHFPAKSISCPGIVALSITFWTYTVDEFVKSQSTLTY
jgi:hypothetical protein